MEHPTQGTPSPWELTDWQADLIQRLPDDMREPVQNAFYYFDIAGTSSQSFFTHLIVLLGAARYWSQDFPRAIEKQSTEAVARIERSTTNFTHVLQQCVRELEHLNGNSLELQRELNTGQKKAVDTLNTLWTRIASQLSNRKFIQVLGEDLAKVLIASQDRVKPQIEASYRELEGTVHQTTELLQMALNNNAEAIRQTMLGGVVQMQRQWEEANIEIQNDLNASKEVKIELAKTYREMRQYVVEIENFANRDRNLIRGMLIGGGVALGLLAGVLLFGRGKSAPAASIQAGPSPTEILSGSGVVWQVNGSSDGAGVITLNGPGLKVEQGEAGEGIVVLSYNPQPGALQPATSGE